MSDQRSDSPPVAESWDTYWRGARGSAPCGGEGSSHRLVLSFWDEFFKTVQAEYNAPSIIDIASGGGAVLERANGVFGGHLPDFTCLDVSAAAIGMIRERFPGARGIVADARATPLAAASYDVATSQFGIEYAGLEAVDEIARLIAPAGKLALLLHNREGGIYRQCAASLDAIERMRSARFIPYSMAMLEKGFAASRGGDRAQYEAAAKRLAPAVREMESIMRDHGRHVADGTIVGLYDEVKRIVSRLQRYEPSDVLNWLKNLDREMPTYAGRMASMCEVAIDAETFSKLRDRVRAQGYTIVRGDALADGPQALAWALVATRG